MKTEVWLARGYGNRLEYEAIKKLARQSPYPVKSLGRLDQPQPAGQMNQTDALVLPSFYERFSLVMVKALVYGLRMVCTGLPGVKPWPEENIGTRPMKFVSLPAIVNADEPIEQELPEFEWRLAGAIGKSPGVNDGSLEMDDNGLSTHDGENMTATGPSVTSPPLDLSCISWADISKEILESYSFI